MLSVALTGGIASGKTTVSDYFSDLGVPIIDMDIISREVVIPGSHGLAALVNEFGTEILDSHNQLKRKHLRKIIFNDQSKRKIIESILHPLILQQTKQLTSQFAQQGTTYCIHVIPLLYESGRANEYKHILVVQSETLDRKHRIIARDLSTAIEAQTIINSQASEKQRNSIATEIIVNDGTIENLRSKVVHLHNHYLHLSGLSIK